MKMPDPGETRFPRSWSGFIWGGSRPPEEYAWDSGCWPGLWSKRRFLPEFWPRIWCQELGLNWEDIGRVGKILPGVQGAGLDSVEWEISIRAVGLVFRELVWSLMGWKASARGTGHDMVSSFRLNDKRLLGLFSIQFPPIYQFLLSECCTGSYQTRFSFMRRVGGHNSLITASLLLYPPSRQLTVAFNNSLTPPRPQAMLRHPHLVLNLIWSFQFHVP